MVIKTIDLERYKDESDGWYEVDLYPARQFEKTVDVMLYRSESYGNFHYHYLFQYYDSRNIRVRIHTVYNLFPIASLLGHTVILQKPFSAEFWWRRCLSRKSSYEFDRKYAWKKYNVTHWEGGGGIHGVLIGDPVVESPLRTGAKPACGLNDVDIWPQESKHHVRGSIGIYGHFEILSLFNATINRTMFIDKRALDIFNEESSHFPKDTLWIEYSGRVGPMSKTMELIRDHSNIPTFVAKKGPLLEKVTHEFEGSKYFLTYQMLCSIYNNVKFSAVGGSASLFSIAPFINCVIMLDGGHNVSHQTGFFKSLFNKAIFNEDTYCFPCEFHKKPTKHSYGVLNKNRLEFIKIVAKNLDNKNLSNEIRIVS